MKLLIVISFVVFITACGDLGESVIDSKFADYKVTKIETPSSFAYSNPDSLFTASVTILNAENVDKVWLSVKSNDGSNYPVKQTFLVKGNTTQNVTLFSSKIPMSKRTSTGKYIVEFFVSDKINQVPDNISKAGEQVLLYDNKQTNYAPVISNLVLPSTVARTVEFVFSLKVEDLNGLGDIAQVTFKLTRPDGTVVLPNPNTPEINYFLMVDNGDPVLGDTKAGDGIYSFKNTFGNTAQTGTWQFEFLAKDKSGALSNQIKQSMVVN